MHESRPRRATGKVIFALAVTLCLSPERCRPQVVEDLVHIRFQTDVRVFTVMAAVDLAGFAADVSDLDSNPVRKLLHERLFSVSADLHERLKHFYESHKTERQDSAERGKYVSFALMIAGPPLFALPAQPTELPQDVRSLAGFEDLLQELWRQGKLDAVWEQARPEYVREIEEYRPLLRNMIVDTLRYLRTEARVALDRVVVFIPDLLNGYGTVNARNIGNDYVVVVGPSLPDERPMRSLRHEYLHFLIDALVSKYFGYLPAAEPHLKKMRELPAAREEYTKDFPLMIAESLLQMTELRLDREPDVRAAKKMTDAYQQGLVLAPYFLESMKVFENRHDAFQDYFPEMIKGISWAVESRRAVAASQHDGRSSPGAKPEGNAELEAMSQDAVRQQQLRRLLTQANQLLADREFDRAALLLQSVLEIAPHNASALFGLGQVAAQAQDFEPALAFYGRAAAGAGTEVWIAGWSLLRRGNIYQYLGDSEKARTEWMKVLSLQGDLRGAEEAAKKALSIMDR